MASLSSEVERGRWDSLAFRLGLALVLVAATPVAESAERSDSVRFALIVGIGWIPVTGALCLLARRRASRWPDAALVAADVTLLALLQAIVAPGPVVVLGATAAVAGHAGYLAATERGDARAGLLRLHEKADAILSGVGEAVVVTTADGRVFQWNQAAARTFGCAPDDAVGRNCAEVLTLRGEVRDLDCRGGCALLASAGPVDVEVWRRAPTGQRQPLLASVAPVVDEDGTVVEVVHSFRDITRLRQADEAKTLFLATASHELKTPLTVIRGFSQLLLLPGMDGPEREDALRAIDVRAAQLNGIVDRLLMSSRIEAGHIELVPRPVDIGPIAVERAETLRAATGRDVAVVVEPGLPPAWAEADAVTTVLDHLLDNAVKYSPDGGPITVSASAVEGHVVVSVADQGVGMTGDQVAHCFDRFWQAETTDVRRFGGTGIGLYIVRSLMDAMGGTISVSSAPGRGSTFRAVLDRADLDGSDPGARGEPSMIREFMRQLGVPVGAAGGGSGA